MGTALCIALLSTALPAAAHAAPAPAQAPTTTVAPAASAQAGETGRVTGFAIPRYASIGGTPARMRVGPGTDYPIRWVYRQRGTPVEIIEEWGNWRMIRDADAATGWMYAPLLSGRRTAITAPWGDEPVKLRSRPLPTAGIRARLGRNVRLDILQCNGTWCRIALPGHDVEGHVRQSALWGVYPSETVD